MIRSWKHSGTTGDLIYSLAAVRLAGGGDFYLHLNQIDWLSQHYYGVQPPEFHRGRMNETDLEFMRELIQYQSYIGHFGPLDPRTTEITDNLDRFRITFAAHPGNYLDCYAKLIRIDSTPELMRRLYEEPWLAVEYGITDQDRPWVINRTQRWISNDGLEHYAKMKQQGQDRFCVFLGLPSEHEAFCKATGWDIPYKPVRNLYEMAQWIKGSDRFIGNQSMALSVAIGLGHPHIDCEIRRDLAPPRNECWFPMMKNINYF